MRVLVLGGRGFLGRPVAAALTACGHRVVVGSRDGGATAAGAPLRAIRCERLIAAGSSDVALADVDAVVNCVGILREAGAATYDRVHHLAPAALAVDCARLSRRRVSCACRRGWRASAAMPATCCASRRSPSAISSCCATTTCRASTRCRCCWACLRAAWAQRRSGQSAKQGLRQIAPSIRRTQSAMMEVDRSRERRERPRPQHGVVQRVGNAAVQQRA